MGKYSEALRKIEEERKKESGAKGSGKPGPNLKPYVIAAVSVLFFILTIAYGYGLRHGVRSSKASVLTHDAIPVQEKMDSDGREDLIQNVEKMLELSYGEPQTDGRSPSMENQIQADYYTIQLVAYSEEIRARQETEKLAREGLDAFILDSGQFYVVCAGRFPGRDQATDWLSSLKNSTFKDGQYQDAFIRLIKLKK